MDPPGDEKALAREENATKAIEAMKEEEGENTGPTGASAPPAGAPAFEVEYRKIVRLAFQLIARGADVDPLYAALVLDEERRLVDEVGVARADAIRVELGLDWFDEYGTCPWCGERTFHAPGGRHR